MLVKKRWMKATTSKRSKTKLRWSKKLQRSMSLKMMVQGSRPTTTMKQMMKARLQISLRMLRSVSKTLPWKWLNR